MEEADKLIQRAMLEKRRGNQKAASDLLEQANDAAPGAASVMEAVGDDLLERRQYGAAQAAYKSAHKADPTNPSIERKLAQLSMTGMAGLSVEDHLRMGSFDSPFIQQGESMANPKVALILSAILPGAGQFAMGQQKKAIRIFSVFFVALIIFVALNVILLPPPPHDALGHPLRDSLGNIVPRPPSEHLPNWAWFPIPIAIIAWFVGILDANAMVKTAGGGPKGTNKPNKPTPPVNLPFE